MGKIKSNRKHEGEMGLNITSMLDMFTIILLFLLKSYSSSSVNITPNENLQLPISTNDKDPEEGLGLSLLKNKITLDNKDIIPLQNGRVPKIHIGKDGRSIMALVAALKKERKKAEYIARNNKSYEFKGTVIIQADKDLEFEMLKKVLFTLGVSGYADFRFAVVKDE